jgi:hypothetical protein
MKPMNQNQSYTRKSNSLAALLAVPLLAMSSQVAHATLAAWGQAPITEGDKTYFFLFASPSIYDNASVNATEAAGIHSLNLTNLAAVANNAYLQYAIQINDPTNYFYLNRTSQNDILGNITGGSTTTVYSDAFSTVLNTTPLVGTQTGATYTTDGRQTIYVQTLITGVNGNTNKIQNVTFDVTQSNDISAVPEVTSSFTMLGLIGSGLLLRRRSKTLR